MSIIDAKGIPVDRREKEKEKQRRYFLCCCLPQIRIESRERADQNGTVQLT